MSITKKVSVVVAVALAGAVAPIGATASAQASSRHCAVRSDYRKVHRGQSLKKVDHELHSKGHREASARSHGYRDMIRTYRTCSEYSAVAVSFSAKPHHAYREAAKDAVWVH